MAKSRKYGQKARQERAQQRQQKHHPQTQIELPLWVSSSSADFIIKKAEEMRGNYKRLSWAHKKLVRQVRLVMLVRRLQELEKTVRAEQAVISLGSEQLRKNLLNELFGPSACCSTCGKRGRLQILSGNMILRKLQNSGREFSGNSFFDRLGEVSPLELRTGLIGQECCAEMVLKILDKNLPADAHPNDRRLHWPGTVKKPGWLVDMWANKRAGILFAQKRKELWRAKADLNGLAKAVKQAHKDLVCLDREKENTLCGVHDLARQLGLTNASVS